MPIRAEDFLNRSKKDKEKVAIFTKNLATNYAPKAKPKTEEEGFFWKALDYLNRGQYMSANTVENILDGDFSSIPKDLYKGLTGEKKGSYIDMAQKYLPENVPNWAKVGVGFIGDVLLDPTTYVSIGGLTKAGKGLKKVGQLATKTDDVGKLLNQARKGQRALITTTGGKALIKGEKVLDVVDKVSDAIKTSELGKDVGKLFSKKTGITKLDDLVDKYLTKRGYLETKSLEFGQKVANNIQNIAKSSGIETEKIIRNVVDLVEKPKSTKPIVKGLDDVALSLKNKFKELLDVEQGAGIKVKALEGEYEYLGRYLDPKVAEAKLKSQYKGSSKVWNTKLGNSLKRKTGDLSIGELNDMVKQSGLKGIDDKTITKLFIEDPSYIVSRRGISSAKATTSAEFLKDVATNFGDDVAKEGFEKLPETVTKLVPELKDKFFEPEIAKEIARTYKNFFDKKEAGAVLKLFDKVQNWWKAWTLSLFPSYHIRNGVSNVYLNYLGDVKNPKRYSDALALQMYQAGGNSKLAKLAGFTKETADDIIEKMKEVGVIGEGMYSVEIPQVLEQGIQKAKTPKDFIKLLGKQFTAEGMPIKAGREMGTLIEDNARIAHYLDKISKGYTPEEAVKSVKKYLFDYSDLSAFERDVLKRVMPFYTFLRKNLPLQIESIITNPRKASKIVKGKKMIEELGDVDDIKIPFINEYIKESAPIKLRMREDGDIDIFLMQNWIPTSDIIKLSEPIEAIASMITPIIKFPVENWLNFNSFFKQAIEKFEGEKQQFLGTDLRKRAVLNPAKVYDIVAEYGLKEGAKAVLGVDLLRNIRLFNELNKLNPGNIFGEKRKGITDVGQFQRWVQLFFGKLQKYDKKKAYDFYEWKTRQELSRMNTSLKKAVREQNYDEAEFLKDKILKIKQQLKLAKQEAKSGKIIKSK